MATRAKQARGLGKRQALGNKKGKSGLRKEAVHHRGDFGADRAGVVREFGTEKGFANDVEGEFGHFLVKVAGLLVAPPGEMRRRGVGHDFRVSGDVFVAEGGLDELALRLPGGAIVGKEAFAEDELERGVIARLLKARGSANKHGLDVVRVRELANGNMEKTEKGDVTEVVRTALAKAGPVVGQFPQVTQEEVTLRTGRTRDESSGGHREMVRQKRRSDKLRSVNGTASKCKTFLATATEECCPARGTLAGHFTRRLSPSPMPGKRIQQRRAYLPLKRSSPRPQFYRRQPEEDRPWPERSSNPRQESAAVRFLPLSRSSCRGTSEARRDGL